MKTIQLKYCRIEWSEFGCVTYFPDGTYVNAIPHWEDPHYHVIAQRCGYANDLMAYCREHEFVHEFLAEQLLGQPSKVLTHLAHSNDISNGIATIEELATQTFQRWLRANEEPIVSGVDWVRLKNKALKLLQ